MTTLLGSSLGSSSSFNSLGRGLEDVQEEEEPKHDQSTSSSSSLPVSRSLDDLETCFPPIIVEDKVH